MHSLSTWRMIPPGGAPLTLTGIGRALRALGGNNDAAIPLQEAFTQRFALPHVFFAGSGRSALSLLFTALRRAAPGRDQILLPAYVSYSVPSAVVHSGCRITLYDLDPHTLTPRLESVRGALSERTLAVLACHLFGYPFDLAPLQECCRETGTVLVDDAAQAMGATVDGRFAGCMGDVGLFSLSRGKNITAVDGGVLLTADSPLAEKLRPLFSHRQNNGLPTFSPTSPASTPNSSPVFGGKGQNPYGEAMHNAALLLKACALYTLRHPAVYRIPASIPQLKLGESIYDPGFSHSRFGTFQAGLALHALEGLHLANQLRTVKAARYARALPTDLGVRPITAAPGSVPVYPRFPLLFDAGGPHNGERDHLPGTVRPKDNAADFFGPRARRLGISRGFPLPVHSLTEAKPHLDCDGQTYPGAEHLAQALFTLPTHDQAGPADCARAMDHVISCARDGARSNGSALRQGKNTGETA